jgi:hypothetical protein
MSIVTIAPDTDRVLLAIRESAFKVAPNTGEWEYAYRARVSWIRRDSRIHSVAATLGVPMIRLAQGLANTSVSVEDAVVGAQLYPFRHGVESSHVACQWRHDDDRYDHSLHVCSYCGFDDRDLNPGPGCPECN